MTVHAANSISCDDLMQTRMSEMGLAKVPRRYVLRISGAGRYDLPTRLMVTLSLLVATLLTGASPAQVFAEDTCAYLQKQAQAFSDAGQRGDGAAMSKVLDPDLIFFNETGERATLADLARATPPASGTVLRTITTTDWDCKIHGDVAVTGFIDVLQQGKQDEMKFRSVETWKKEGADWKMIGSETLTLHQDPESISLDGKTLDQYVGTYRSSAGMTFTFTREGGELAASLNGGTKTAQKAQSRDIFFTAGHGDTPKIFQRSDDGRIVRFIYLRGKDSIVFTRAD